MLHNVSSDVPVLLLLCLLFFPPFLLRCSYDNDGTSKDEIKERFCQTMEFVENYLRDVVCQSFPFADKEKNKLTFEVSCARSKLLQVSLQRSLADLTHLRVPLLGRQPRQEPDLFRLLQLQRPAEADKDPAGHPGLRARQHHLSFQQDGEKRWEQR